MGLLRNPEAEPARCGEWIRLHVVDEQREIGSVPSARDVAVCRVTAAVERVQEPSELV
ncbi:MAG: hypothetical protein KatS3mg059_0794 [Thermomicrobiales bacterium]|nr:MAG: hypothetical protein KatS3mg059_0794 [Thermomicrobiales bacterium]